MIRLVFAISLATALVPTALAEEVRHSFLTADSSKGRIAIIDEDGQTKWETKIGPLHDLHRLPTGNVLFQKNWTHIVEMKPESQTTPKSQTIEWEFDAAKSPKGRSQKTEVHAFERLANGRTMIVESGAARIIELDKRGDIVFEMPLVVSKPHPHRDTRLVRKLDSGNFLVCHEGDGIVREYEPSRTQGLDDNAKIAWEYAVPLMGRERAKGHGPEAFGNQCFCALRLKNGNTLISTGNGHSVIEVTPQKDIVWKIEQNDLPEITLAWVTTLEVLPNGNIVIGNCHAGPENPQIIEVDRQKNVFWKFHDFKRFGNALTNTQILTTNGHPIVDSIR
ncbi:MAG TPA: hypothetical protein DDW52_14870 [Planctomycetaceae bacterium]|nr:hypothetical protein [Planctomycetaceae bacterium]